MCLLHSDLQPAHEMLGRPMELEADGHDVTCSREVSPEFREYERTVTTVVNAYLRPACRSYLRGLADAADVGAGHDVGRRAGAGRGRRRAPGGAPAVGPGRAVCSPEPTPPWPTASPTPSPSTWAARRTDVCLVLDGQPAPAAEREVAGLPVRLPSLDVHTIGAGGGSIARLDDGGALVVGPRSAGRGTGAGLLRPGWHRADRHRRRPRGRPHPGRRRLPRARAARPVDAAERALDDAGVSAEGVLAVVDAAMEQALRAVSVERGVDPRGLALVAFGGAGPLHACALADALGMPAVIVPARAGVLSAVGILARPAAGRPGPLGARSPRPPRRPPALRRVVARGRDLLFRQLGAEPGAAETEVVEYPNGRARSQVRRPVGAAVGGAAADDPARRHLRLPVRRPEPRAERAPSVALPP